jgi:hypothetical protein
MIAFWLPRHDLLFSAGKEEKQESFFLAIQPNALSA